MPYSLDLLDRLIKSGGLNVILYVKNHGHTLYTAIQNLVGIFVVVLFFEMNYYFSSATMH